MPPTVAIGNAESIAISLNATGAYSPHANALGQWGCHSKEGGQVRRVSETVCLVKSQTIPGTTYTLTRTAHGWDCTCPDDIPFCKHIWALVHLAGDKGRAERGLSIYRAGHVQKVVTASLFEAVRLTQGTHAVPLMACTGLQHHRVQ